MEIKILDHVDSPINLELFKAINKNSEAIFLDTETNGLDEFTNDLLLVQLGIGNIIYIIDVYGFGVGPLTGVINSIKLSNVPVVAHNAKFDIKFLFAKTNVLLSNVHDTMVVEAVITMGIGERFPSLADLALKYNGTLLDKHIRSEFIDMPFGSEISNQQMLYSARDVSELVNIYSKQLEIITRDKLTLTYNLEKRVVAPISSMESNGIQLDAVASTKLTSYSRNKAEGFRKEFLDMMFAKLDFSKYENALVAADTLKISVKTKSGRKALELITGKDDIKNFIEQVFNIESNTQLPALFTATGLPLASTNEKVLTKLDRTPEIVSLLSYREYNKLAGTYGENILDLVNPVTKRIHTTFNSVGTRTGRFSSNKPNLQNIPATDEYRAMFIPQDGFSFINMDYSQQEFRLAGAVSGEDKIIEAYKLGADMHTATAAIIFKKELSQIEKKERQFGKTLNFAILYGTTEYGLKKNLNISIDEALEVIGKFYAGYPKLSAFKKMAEDRIEELGYSMTPIGRRRYFPPRPAFSTPREVEMYRSSIRREGFNHIIQGGGADVTKMALAKMFETNPFGDKFKLVLQVHDEIGAEVEDSIVEEAVDFMQTCMISVFEPFLRGIPAQVEYKIGKKWQK